MTGPELKPCPFCGEPATFERIGDSRASTIVACTYCGCRHECGEEWGHGRAWNTRADLPATDAQALANPKVRALVDALQLFTWSYLHESDKIIDAFYAAELAIAALEKDRT